MTRDPTSIFGESLSRFIPTLSNELIRSLARKISLVTIRSGEVLYRQDQPGNGMHILLTGRLLIRVVSDQGEETKFVTRKGAGTIIGEISLFTRCERTATVVATRDCTLGYLSRDDFDGLMEKHPAMQLDAAHFIIDRLVSSQKIENGVKRITQSIALVTLSPELDISSLSAQLKTSLDRFGLASAFSSNSVAITLSEKGDETQLEHFLEAQEEKNDYVILETNASPDRWSKKILRFVDKVIFVAPFSASVDEASSLAENFLQSTQRTSSELELVLIHDEDTYNLAGTYRWLDALSVNRHHHIREGSRSDYDRLARNISGNAVALILSGGGARSFAHLGVIRAMREAHIPIDMVGGTSQGALVAAGVALGWDYARMLKEFKEAYVDVNPGNDYTIPIFSVIKGRKMARGLRRHFGDIKIEDMHIPFFSVSSNLTTGGEKIHRTGSLWRSLRASVSLPAFLPPVIENSEILVDGGLVNNLPVKVAKDIINGYVVVIDVSPKEDFFYEGEEFPSAWSYIKNSFLRKENKAPTLTAILTKAILLGNRKEAEKARRLADLYLAPSVGEFDLLKWRLLQKISDKGYEQCREQVFDWAKQHPELTESKNAAMV